MSDLQSRGTCHHDKTGQKILGMEFAGRRVTMVSDTGDALEAAWLAYFGLAAFARSMGLKEVVLKTTSRHVVNHLTGKWKARSAMTRRYRDAFRMAFADMTIVHTY